MRTSTTSRLLALVLALGAVIVVLERENFRAAPPAPRPAFALPVDPVAATGLWYEQGGGVVELEKSGESWRMLRPVEAPADSARIAQLLSELAELPRRVVEPDRHPAPRGAALAPYGLERPALRIVVKGAWGEHELQVGRPSALGDERYALRGGGDDLFLTAASAADAFPADPSVLRSRSLFRGDASTVSRVELRRMGGLLQIRKRGSGLWELQQPSVARADEAQVAHILEQVLRQAVREFVADGVTDATTYGLEENSDHIALQFNGEEAPQTLQLGRAMEGKPGLLYARFRGRGSVFAVDTGLRDVLSLSAADLRDRRLVGFRPDEVGQILLEGGGQVVELLRATDGSWSMVRPRTWKADAQRVQALLELWASTRVQGYLNEDLSDLAAAGFEPPLRTLSFSAPGAATEPKLLSRVKVAQPAPDQEPSTMRALLEPEGAACLLPAMMADPAFLDPLFFRDRVVLELDPKNILRVTVAIGGCETTVERDAGGVFISLDAERPRIDGQALDLLLARIVRLPCESFARDASAENPAFIPAPPFATVTFGLTGEAGLARALLIGEPAPSGGRYAAIRGQEAVFILGAQTLEILLRDLVAPASGGSTEGEG